MQIICSLFINDDLHAPCFPAFTRLNLTDLRILFLHIIILISSKYSNLLAHFRLFVGIGTTSQAAKAKWRGLKLRELFLWQHLAAPSA